MITLTLKNMEFASKSRHYYSISILESLYKLFHVRYADVAPGFRNKQLMAVSAHSNVDRPLKSFWDPATITLVTALKLVKKRSG